jgi:hypothetical protein
MINFQGTIIETARAGVISEAPGLVEVGGNILSFLLEIFSLLAIISLAVAGVGYFLSYGNEKQIEKSKKMAFYSIVGIVVALGALVVVRQLGDFFK